MVCHAAVRTSIDRRAATGFGVFPGRFLRFRIYGQIKFHVQLESFNLAWK